MDPSLNFGYDLQEVQMDRLSVNVISSTDRTDAIKGVVNNEVASNLLSQSQTQNDKWLVENFSSLQYAWVVLEFAQPVLVRALGIKSANDCPDRDPREIKVCCSDFLEQEQEVRQRESSLIKQSFVEKETLHKAQTKKFKLFGPKSEPKPNIS